MRREQGRNSRKKPARKPERTGGGRAVHRNDGPRRDDRRQQMDEPSRRSEPPRRDESPRRSAPPRRDEPSRRNEPPRRSEPLRRNEPPRPGRPPRRRASLLSVIITLILMLGIIAYVNYQARQAEQEQQQISQGASQETTHGTSQDTSQGTEISTDKEGTDGIEAPGKEGAGSTDSAGSAGKDGIGSADAGTMEVHFLEVGQGDATLIICGDETMLIDCSVEDYGTKIQNYLQKRGITQLDYLILTHPDSDHIGGAPVVIQKFDIKQVFMSDFVKDNKTYDKLVTTLKTREFSWVTPEVGSTWELGEAQFTIVGPAEKYDDPNDASVSLVLTHGENTFLFTGDMEEAAEKDMVERDVEETSYELRADVYKAGHHGSKTSSCEELLDVVNPTYAVISCGEGNSYGHPHAATLNQFRERGVKVFRTDEQGSIIATSDGTQITWNCAPSETWQVGEGN